MDDRWDEEFECPRCGHALTPRGVEYKDGRDCPRCGAPAHPAFAALDALCAG